ncbi:hypothetical protein FACS18949_15540 [Clostridia bacterium]|nr:hypothetical protein FACS18949_15540 [Clostridia bacterium]
MTLSSCGIDCAACKFAVEQNCPGCHNLNGKPFWSSGGVCDLYACADGKGLHNCGKCGEFPCGTLHDWAYQEEGENGRRIENLKSLFSELAAHLRSLGMSFERGKDYWADKLYWVVNYKGESVCYVLLNDEAVEPWTIWSDDSGSDWFESYPLDVQTKEIAWEHVDFCGNCGSCDGGTTKTIFGKAFDNVCRTTFRLDNPTAKAVECVKKLMEIRKIDIAGGENNEPL